MTVFNQIMQDEYFRKRVLIEFGFGEVEPKKVEEWFEKEFNQEYWEFKQIVRNGNVIGFNPKTVEASTVEERNAVLTKEDREKVTVYKDELDQIFELVERSQLEKQGLFHTMNSYIEDKGLRKDFINYLKKKKIEVDEDFENYYGDIEKHIKEFE